MDIQTQIDRKEQQLKDHYATLADLKAEFQKAETPGVRQLIHEDISAVYDAIDICEGKLAKLRKELTA